MSRCAPTASSLLLSSLELSDTKVSEPEIRSLLATERDPELSTVAKVDVVVQQLCEVRAYFFLFSTLDLRVEWYKGLGCVGEESREQGTCGVGFRVLG